MKVAGRSIFTRFRIPVGDIEAMASALWLLVLLGLQGIVRPGALWGLDRFAALPISCCIILARTLGRRQALTLAGFGVLVVCVVTFVTLAAVPLWPF
jgi:hypothetical protein